jgi:hypothetical protein
LHTVIGKSIKVVVPLDPQSVLALSCLESGHERLGHYAGETQAPPPPPPAGNTLVDNGQASAPPGSNHYFYNGAAGDITFNGDTLNGAPVNAFDTVAGGVGDYIIGGTEPHTPMPAGAVGNCAIYTNSPGPVLVSRRPAGGGGRRGGQRGRWPSATLEHAAPAHYLYPPLRPGDATAEGAEERRGSATSGVRGADDAGASRGRREVGMADDGPSATPEPCTARIAATQNFCAPPRPRRLKESNAKRRMGGAMVSPSLSLRRWRDTPYRAFLKKRVLDAKGSRARLLFRYRNKMHHSAAARISCFGRGMSSAFSTSCASSDCAPASSASRFARRMPIARSSARFRMLRTVSSIRCAVSSL